MIPEISIPLALFIAGILTQTWLISRFSRILSKSLSFIGIPFGIYIIALAISSAINGTADTLSIILLTLAGVTLLSKPLKNVKWAAMLAILIGALFTYSLNQLFPNIPFILLLLTFSVLVLMAYLILKFAEDLFQTIGMLLNLPPVSTAIGIFCILKAFILVI